MDPYWNNVSRTYSYPIFFGARLELYGNMENVIIKFSEQTGEKWLKEKLPEKELPEEVVQEAVPKVPQGEIEAINEIQHTAGRSRFGSF